MKNLILLAIISVSVFSLGMISMAEAHPHTTIDVMNTHSHDLYTSEDFLIHTFEQVVLFVGQIQTLLNG